MPVVLTVPIWPVALGVRKRSPVPWAAASGRSVGDRGARSGSQARRRAAAASVASDTRVGRHGISSLSGREIPRWLVQAMALPARRQGERSGGPFLRRAAGGSNSGRLSEVLIFLTHAAQPPSRTPRVVRSSADPTSPFASARSWSWTARPTSSGARAGPVKLERIPLEILLLLTERPGQLVTREQIAERIWGKGAYLDVDNSINGAVRKIRQVLEDDPEQPRFIQTVTGRGYRFVAPVLDPADAPAEAPGAAPPEPAPPRRRSRGQAVARGRPGAAAPPRRPGLVPRRGARTARRAGSCWRSCRFRISPATRGRSTSATGSPRR